MIGARKAVKRVASMMVPRVSTRMRQNEVFRWTNRIVWLGIVLAVILAVFFGDWSGAKP